MSSFVAYTALNKDIRRLPETKFFITVEIQVYFQYFLMCFSSFKIFSGFVSIAKRRKLKVEILATGFLLKTGSF